MFRKIPTEVEMLAALQRGEIAFPPLSLAIRPPNEWIAPLPRTRRVNNSGRPFQGLERAEASARDAGVDAILTASWNGRSQMFALECKASSTPATMKAAVQQVRLASRPPLLWPMVFVPYLSEEQLSQLEREGVSGLDLCGNGLIMAPGEMLVSRAGRPNLYPQSAPIKNVFRGTSSLVARVFLLRPTYSAVGEIREEIERLGGTVALSTVSKALSRLEEELIVGRQSGEIRLLQPDKLLQRLVENYRPPEVTRRFLGKTNVRPESLLMPQLDWASKNGASLVMTGASSARLYGGALREQTIPFYCSDVAGLLERLGSDVREQDHFPNLELLETDDGLVSFDRKVIGGCPWASPLQSYLELATGGKREQEMAEPIKLILWRNLTNRAAG